MSLSDKSHRLYNLESETEYNSFTMELDDTCRDFIDVEDVKQFIKDLKEACCNDTQCCCNEIDKLAGEKLI